MTPGTIKGMGVVLELQGSGSKAGAWDSQVGISAPHISGE